MSASRLALLNKGLVFGSAFAALILLAVFYSVVSSAVERAESRRLEAATPATPQVVGAATHRQGAVSANGLVLVGTRR